MDLHISFGEIVICTTMYVKLVALDQLLLSEAVCCQLGIVSYHPNVQSVHGCHATVTSTRISDCKSDTLSVRDKELEAEELEQQATNKSNLTIQSETTEKMKQLVASAEDSEENPTEKYPSQTIKDERNVQGEASQNSGDGISQVRLIKAVCLPANHSATVPVQITYVKGTVLLEPSKSLDQSLQVFLEVKEGGSTAIVIVNNSNSSCQLKKGLKLGEATGTAIVDHTKQGSLLTP